jgi:hypothetical protein
MCDPRIIVKSSLHCHALPFRNGEHLWGNAFGPTTGEPSGGQKFYFLSITNVNNSRDIKHFPVILTARIAKANPGFGIVGPFEPKPTLSKRGSSVNLGDER